MELFYYTSTYWESVYGRFGVALFEEELELADIWMHPGTMMILRGNPVMDDSTELKRSHCQD